MSYYPQFPFYAYPMAFPNQDMYMYPHGAMPDGTIYFDQPGMMSSPGRAHKPGYNNRKDSVDSGISDFSGNSRKTSSVSAISASSIAEEDPSAIPEQAAKEEPPFVEPAEDLCLEIVTQVEFYFSDANITKDKFLLKHVKRNKEGFVSLKLISSFKRVKHLTKDWRQVAFAIEQKSKKLEVNDLKTKVRRLDPLPEYDETTPSRTVVALNLPVESPNMEAVAEIFSPCGDIVLIRILRPGNPVPADIKPFANKHPEMLAKTCALVEFEKTEFALKAVKDLHHEEEDKMTVMELTAVPVKNSKAKVDQAQRKSAAKQLVQSGPVPQRRFSHAGFHQNPDQLTLGPRRRISLMHNMKFDSIAEEEQKKQQDQFSLNPNAPTFQMHQGPMRRLSRPSFVHPGAMEMQMQMQAALMSQNQWMFRRIHHGDFAAPAGLTLPPNVVRMPRGPERGKGFQKWCRTRMETTDRINKKPERSHAVPIVAPPKEEPKVEETSEAEQSVESPAQAVPDGAAALPAAEAAPAAGDHVVPEGNSDNSSNDSGHEDGCLSDAENERSR